VSRNHSSHTISLSQEAYICNLVERFGLQNAAVVTTPLAPGAILTKDQCPATAEELRDVHNNNYCELIGSLQYVALATRPDINFATSKLAQFLSDCRALICGEDCAGSDWRSDNGCVLKSKALRKVADICFLWQRDSVRAVVTTHAYFKGPMHLPLARGSRGGSRCGGIEDVNAQT